MGKLKIVVVVTLLMLLSSCSFLETVNDSIDYVETTTEHMNKLTTFAEDAPQQIQAALTDSEMKQELEDEFLTLKTDIEDFINMTDIPSIAEDIHQELVSKNQTLLDEMNKVLENGQLALDELENSQLFTTINEVTSLMDQIENLTQ